MSHSSEVAPTDPDHKDTLLNRIDEISGSEEFMREIEAFEAAAAYCVPAIPRDLSELG